MPERKSYNIGEWSEIYTLFRLLENGKLFAADENLNHIKSGENDIFFPILRIIREENIKDKKNNLKLMKNNYNFFPRTSDNKTIQVFLNDDKIFDDTTNEFADNANILLEAMQSKDKDKKSLLLENIYSFLKKLHIEKIKQSADKKADIIIKIHDIQTGYEPIVGFSIKSFIGSNPTLFNAGKTTHFIYKVNNIDIDKIHKINSIESPTARFAKMFSCNPELEFIKMENKTFHDNLVMIDSLMPKFMSEMIKVYYEGKATKCSDIVNYLNSTFMTKTELPKLFLEYKVKEFLCAVALGMHPAKIWNGKDEANGGYIIVRRDGNIVAYHLYNRDFFKEYLYKRTKFEKPDERIEYGSLYEENGNVYIKLTLQVRFK